MDEMRDLNKSTISALLKEKPKPGRPRRAVSRQTVYVELSPQQKELMQELAAKMPATVSRADIPDIAINYLAARLNELKQSMDGRDREMPEGVVDLLSLYLLWDLTMPQDKKTKWTSVRLSQQQAIQLGRLHGELNALFGTTRSQTFSLGLALICDAIDKKKNAEFVMSNS